ncbi:MAG: RraA family protein [Alphaproteobacteria bacterium]|nr:RraA family protein [Alphaproteobacteria bacterium]MBU0805387.1 RraA family protein [Alphaproteobacteria bacterium]MBU0873333.1 RraA family protein [Alphaproteobacteria bacterium]MBU1401439.1 RraA family protein [Alphaproteobacteria bacterium]MBU1592144.1 RraA family protein [Alphaproteobacteria bacterium]
MSDIYRIEPLPAQLDPGRVSRLAKVEAATLGHYLHAGFVDSAIRPLIVGPRAAGAAVTVQIAGPDSTLLYYAMDRVRPGDMLVIDRVGDHKQACWGGFMAAVARIRGLAGVIVDGAVTDPAAIIAAGVPTWARATSAITTKLLNIGGGFNVPVSIGGVAIVPGDAVLADDCGVVVVPSVRLDELTDRALAEQAEEGDWIERVEKGEMLQDLIDIRGMLEKNGMEGAGV